MRSEDRPRPGSVSLGGLLGWALYDWAGNAFATVVITFVFSAYFVDHVASDPTAGSTWWGLALGAAGVLVALSAPLLGAALDQAGRRKPWLVGSTLVAVLATAALVAVQPQPGYAPLALILVGVGVVGSELAAVAYNSMLPELVPPERTGRWSGLAWALGYAGGLVCLLLVLFGLVREGAWLALPRQEALHVRAAFPFSAAWYALFTLPLLLLTPDRARRGPGLRGALGRGARQLRETWRAARGHRPLIRFLLARMLYIDGVATIFAFGGVFAAGAVGLSGEDVLWFGIAMSVSAGVGAAVFAWVDEAIGARRTILLALVGLALPGAGAVLTGSTGLFWACALLMGLFVGPVQSASRSYLAQAAPPQLRGEAFGLYAFSGKVTAFSGPLLVGGLTWLSGSQRVGMSAVLLLLGAGFLLMLGTPEAGAVSGERRAPPARALTAAGPAPPGGPGGRPHTGT